MTTYLKPEFDNAKSFYNKAVVEIDENGNKHLYSYNTLVCELDGLNSVAKVYNVQSQITLRHIKEFLRQNGFVADTKSKLLRIIGWRDMNRFEYWRQIVLSKNADLDHIVELMANDENITNEQYCQLYSLALEVY